MVIKNIQPPGRPPAIHQDPRLNKISQALSQLSLIPGKNNWDAVIGSIIDVADFSEDEKARYMATVRLGHGITYQPINAAEEKRAILYECFPTSVHPNILHEVFPGQGSGSIYPILFDYIASNKPEARLLLMSIILGIAQRSVTQSIDRLINNIRCNGVREVSIELLCGKEIIEGSSYSLGTAPPAFLYGYYLHILEIVTEAVIQYTNAYQPSSTQGTVEQLNVDRALRILLSLRNVTRDNFHKYIGYPQNIGELRTRILDTVLSRRYQEAEDIIDIVSHTSSRKADFEPFDPGAEA